MEQYDEFFEENVSDFNDRLNFISNFSGSFGFSLILKNLRRVPCETLLKNLFIFTYEQATRKHRLGIPRLFYSPAISLLVEL